MAAVADRWSRRLAVLVLLASLLPTSLEARDTSRPFDRVRPAPHNRTRWLFDDTLAPGIHDTSWALHAVERHFVHDGMRAIEVIPGRNGAFRLSFAPGHFTESDRLGFWIDSADADRLSVRAMIWRNGRESLGPPVPLKDHLLAGAGGALESVWRRAAVPTSALAAPGERITGFVWQAPDDDHPAPFFLDEIALLPRNAQLPVLSECANTTPVDDFVRLRDGALWSDDLPFRAVGTNMYFLQQQFSRSLRTGDPQPFIEARMALDATACAGATVVRLIGFNDSPPERHDNTVIQTAPGVYREAGLRRLDLAIAEAQAHHLRVILTLTNNWIAFGGLPRYADWAHVPPEDVARPPIVRDWVADYARMLSTRVNTFTGIAYRDDPTILAVELVNELRCHGCEAGEDATAFQLALAHEVRKAFPNQLIADGGEGFDDTPALYPGLEENSAVRGDDGTSFHRLAESPDIDLVSYHLYPDSWGFTPAQAEAYIDAHEAIARRAGKVAYLGEFGEQTLDSDRALTYDRWLSRLFVRDNGTLALVWQVTYPGRVDNDGFALIPGESEESIGSLARYADALTR